MENTITQASEQESFEEVLQSQTTPEPTQPAQEQDVQNVLTPSEEVAIPSVVKAEMDISNLIDKFAAKKKNNTKNQNQNQKKKSEQKIQVIIPNVSDNRIASRYIKKAFKDTVDLAPYRTETDGVTHINISGIGKTTLGRFLDMFTNADFNHKELGIFNSIAAFECYVIARNPDSAMRYLSGKPARDNIRQVARREVEGLDILVADAAWQRLLSYPEMCKALMENELPFASYFYLNRPETPNKRIEVYDYNWYYPVIEEMKNTLIARKSDPDAEPNFSFLE